MTPKQLNKLNLLTKHIPRCALCQDLRKNGMAIPFWTEKSKFGIMAEAPGREEVLEENKTPLVGASGKLLFNKEFSKLGFKREDFLIINTIQCRPVLNGRNGKPKFEEINRCRFWVEKYFEVSKVKYLIAFGNYSLWYFFEEISGIRSKCGTIRDYNGIKIFPSIHPSSVLYNPEDISLLRKSLNLFKKEVSR